MDANEKQGAMINELLKHTIELRRTIENSAEHISYKSGLIKVLMDIEKILSSQPLDLDKLGKDEFGIFRMVTDSSSLENGAIGKELMSLLNNFYLFRQTVKKISTNSNQ